MNNCVACLRVGRIEIIILLVAFGQEWLSVDGVREPNGL
jgi:hypothetical protein